MRICFAIPHFFRGTSTGDYGSERTDRVVRAAILKKVVLQLHYLFGTGQFYFGTGNRCNTICSGIAVLICTSGEKHLLSDIPSNLYSHISTRCDPRLLGYECHSALAERVADFDFLCYLEDDLMLTDPSLFEKLCWFCSHVGEDAIIQPHRYEIGMRPQPIKLYIDGRLNPKLVVPTFQDIKDRHLVSISQYGSNLIFERTENPHSGCFFLSASQMRKWIEEPYFLDRSAAWVGPLESAATLGVMRSFRVYKPAIQNASFFEIEHLDVRYIPLITVAPTAPLPVWPP